MEGSFVVAYVLNGIMDGRGGGREGESWGLTQRRYDAKDGDLTTTARRGEKTAVHRFHRFFDGTVREGRLPLAHRRDADATSACDAAVLR